MKTTTLKTKRDELTKLLTWISRGQASLGQIERAQQLEREINAEQIWLDW